MSPPVLRSTEPTGLWRRAQAVFDEVATADASARDSVLAQRCSDDPELRLAVESLLAHDTEDGFLELPWKPPAGAVGELTQEHWLGSSVGPYRLTRELGRGSSSLVFLAERADAEFEHEVAVKVLTRAPSPQAHQRFRQERQILAQLEHPNIARLIGGGSTRGGLPYLMIEWVDGLPITTWCDRHRASIEQRLELHCEVCSAVQYAHRNLIVHRDLKPSNILVTAEGRIKLLDFGIAKLLAGDPAVDTRTETRWMTPAYASPEQILGRSITTSTDIYSLGVILYELLCGQRPQEPDPTGRWRISPAEIRRPPSDRTDSTMAEGLTEIAAVRGLSPARLRSRLRGDLDHIVLRALREEPLDRWASAEELASDVRRHLNGMPIEARRGSTLYRVGKFVRRHTAWVGTAIVLLLIVLGTSAIAVWQSVKRTEERDLARREKVKAETVADTLIGLFRLMEPEAGRDYSDAAKSILDQGGDRVARDFQDQPEIQANLLNAIGSIYRELGFYPEAETLLRRALLQRREMYGGEHLQVAETLLELGKLRTDQGRLPEAELLLRRAVALRRDLAEDGSLASCLEGLGNLLKQRGDYAAAAEALSEAIAIDRRLGSTQEAQAASRLNSLALVLRQQDRNAEAEALSREALEIYRRTGGDHHINVAALLNNLASLAVARGDFESGARDLSQALGILRRLRGDSHPDVQVVVANLAVVLHQSGQYAAAEPLYREALANQRQKTGDRHPDVALYLNNLGVMLREMGRLEDARQMLLQALALRRELLGDDHPNVASTLNNVGLVELDSDRWQDAEQRFSQALEIARASLGEHHRQVGISLGNLAKAALAARQPRRALRFAEEGDAVFAKNLPEEHWRRAENAGLRGAALGMLGERRQAEQLLVVSLRRLEESRGKDSRQARETAARLQQIRDP
ncbi:MAG: serine/threonine-protein kinase [Acidobacteriota bacterium]